jgi:16S rRNA (cytosine1402-N4)-methyltransferase
MVAEVLEVLAPHPGGRYVDCTLGTAGHAWAVLVASAPSGLLLGLEVDPDAMEIAGERLKEFASRAILRNSSYARLSAVLAELGWDQVDGILLDLGVSSLQFGTATRGFSFNLDGPLDMRMDPTLAVSAADLVNTLPVEELAGLLLRYGEERRANAIARAIVASRPVTTTRQLRDCIVSAVGWRRGERNPALHAFQALRIAVNNELGNLEEVLPQAARSLSPGGKLCVITYHSLEDRIVKRFIRQASLQPKEPAGSQALPLLIDQTPHPRKPSRQEILRNPRARSAHLRVAEKRPMA